MATVALTLAWLFSPGAGARLAWGAASAVTDPDAERTARQHFHEGETHYAAARYADALAAYQAGYDAEPLPGFLVNIAQCQRRLGDLQRARATYGKFVLVAPDSPLASEVRGLIADLDRLIEETAAAERRSPAGTSGNPPGASQEHQTPNDTAPEILPLAASEPPVESHAPAGANLVATSVVEAPVPPATDEGHAGLTVRHRWWLWSSVAAVVVGAAALAVVLSSTPNANILHDGSLGTLRR